MANAQNDDHDDEDLPDAAPRGMKRRKVPPVKPQQYAVPSSQGGKVTRVLNPHTARPLPDDGETVAVAAFWTRRESEGVVKLYPSKGAYDSTKAKAPKTTGGASK